MSRNRNPALSAGNPAETMESGRASILKMAFVRGRSLTSDEEERVRVANTNLRLVEHWHRHPPR